MAETARSLCTRALRLINEPGRGATLGGEDLNDAFDVLKDIIASEGVSKNFKPGVTRHFFEVSTQSASYTYGPGGAFDTDDFLSPIPTKIEDAYLRQGSTIQNNELILNGNFEDGSNSWALGAGWSVLNGVALFDQSVGDSILVQSVTPTTITPGNIYIFSFDAIINSGGINAVFDTQDVDITASDSYSFEFTAIQTDLAFIFSSVNVSGDNVQLDNISCIEKNKAKTELIGTGSDYPVRVMDQRTYNREFSKGSGGRPDRLFFSRNYPLAEIVFDRAPTIGEIIVMDVTTDFTLATVDTVIPMHDNALKFLRYQIASDIAPEYGKALTGAQMAELRKAKGFMLSGNSRKNRLRVDGALLTPKRFNINQGDF